MRDAVTLKMHGNEMSLTMVYHSKCCPDLFELDCGFLVLTRGREAR